MSAVHAFNRTGHGPVHLAAVPGQSGRAESRDRRQQQTFQLRQVDWVVVVCALTLCAVGALLVASATRRYQLDHRLDPYADVKRHVASVVAGFILAAVVAGFSLRMWRRLTPAIYVLALIPLAAVPFVGARVNGARSWIALADGFEFQPSEFAKLALVLTLALVLGRARTNRRRLPDESLETPSSSQLAIALLVAAVPLGMVMLQPDLGTAFIAVAVTLGVLAVSGAPARWVALLAALGGAAGVAVVRFGLLQPYQQARLSAFLNLDSVRASGAGYNVRQSLIANAHGGLLGRGLFTGSQTQGRFVPAQKTDFIFTVAGEELGFAGCAAVIVVFGLLLWRILAIAQRAPDRFGTLVCVGVVIWLATQAFINIGMTIGIMPVTGLPLPFLSYGGTAMVANLVALGLVQRVRMSQRQSVARVNRATPLASG